MLLVLNIKIEITTLEKLLTGRDRFLSFTALVILSVSQIPLKKMVPGKGIREDFWTFSMTPTTVFGIC